MTEREGRFCEKHEEWCPDGVCRWCEPEPPDDVEREVLGRVEVVHHGEFTISREEAERLINAWTPPGGGM